MRHVGLLCWFPPVGNSRSKRAAVGKQADLKRVGGKASQQERVCERRCGGRDTAFSEEMGKVQVISHVSKIARRGHPVLSITATKRARLDAVSRASLFPW